MAKSKKAKKKGKAKAKKTARKAVKKSLKKRSARKPARAKAAKKKSPRKAPKKAARKKAPARKPAARPAARKQVTPKAVAAAPASLTPPGETRIGIVTHYYSHLMVAVVRVEAGMLRVGDAIHIKGHTTDFRQIVTSLELDHVHVTEVRAGQSAGTKVTEHAREHDIVYRPAVRPVGQ